MDTIQYIFASDPLPTPSESSLIAAYEEGQTAHAALERNHGGGFDHPALGRAWRGGWEDAEIEENGFDGL